MRVTFEFSDLAPEAEDVEVPAIPRIGEQMLWTIRGGAPDGSDLETVYQVAMVTWTMSPEGESDVPFILVSLKRLADA